MVLALLIGALFVLPGSQVRPARASGCYYLTTNDSNFSIAHGTAAGDGYSVFVADGAPTWGFGGYWQTVDAQWTFDPPLHITYLEDWWHVTGTVGTSGPQWSMGMKYSTDSSAASADVIYALLSEPYTSPNDGSEHSTWTGSLTVTKLRIALLFGSASGESLEPVQGGWVTVCTDTTPGPSVTPSLTPSITPTTTATALPTATGLLEWMSTPDLRPYCDDYLTGVPGLVGTMVNPWGVGDYPTSAFNTVTAAPTATGIGGGMPAWTAVPTTIGGGLPAVTAAVTATPKPRPTVNAGDCKPKPFGSKDYLRENPIMEISEPTIDEHVDCVMVTGGGDVSIPIVSSFFPGATIHVQMIVLCYQVARFPMKILGMDMYVLITGFFLLRIFMALLGLAGVKLTVR